MTNVCVIYANYIAIIKNMCKIGKKVMDKQNMEKIPIEGVTVN